MSTSLLYHALGIRDYGRTDHFASNGRGLAAGTARGSVTRVRLWPWFTPFGHAAIVAWPARRGSPDAHIISETVSFRDSFPIRGLEELEEVVVGVIDDHNIGIEPQAILLKVQHASALNFCIAQALSRALLNREAVKLDPRLCGRDRRDLETDLTSTDLPSIAMIVICQPKKSRNQCECRTGKRLGPRKMPSGRSTGSCEVAGYEIHPSDGADGRAGDRGRLDESYQLCGPADAFRPGHSLADRASRVRGTRCDRTLPGGKRAERRAPSSRSSTSPPRRRASP